MKQGKENEMRIVHNFKKVETEIFKIENNNNNA